MKRLGLDDKQSLRGIVLSRISWAKNHMLDPQELYLQSADPKTEKIAHLFEEYAKNCAKPTPSTSTISCSKPRVC